MNMQVRLAGVSRVSHPSEGLPGIYGIPFSHQYASLHDMSEYYFYADRFDYHPVAGQIHTIFSDADRIPFTWFQVVQPIFSFFNQAVTWTVKRISKYLIFGQIIRENTPTSRSKDSKLANVKGVFL